VTTQLQLINIIIIIIFFSIPFLFGLTALQQFILSVCKLPDGDENKLFIYKQYRTLSALAVSSVSVTYSWHGRSVILKQNYNLRSTTFLDIQRNKENLNKHRYT
jgi:hypothetical protein